MTQYVYSFTPDGAVHGLLNDKVLDTRIFGERSVERITLIEHHNGNQKFYIRWLKGPWAGCVHVAAIERDILYISQQAFGVVQFDTYEEAVQHEIKCVNELRRRGVDFTK